MMNVAETNPPADQQAGADSQQNLLIQTFTLKPVAAVNDVRVTIPSMAMNARDGIRCRVIGTGGRIAQAQAEEGNIFIWQRQILTPDTVKEHLGLLKSGYVTVGEWDDDPRLWDKIVKTDFFTLRCVHAVQTSTPELAQFLRQYNPNIAIFQNQIAELPPMRPDESFRRPVRLFFGALNREADWAPVMPHLNEALSRLRGAVHVQVVHDADFYEALDTEHKKFQPTCDYDTYKQLLRESDIALLPLSDTPSNRLKSDLKFIECAANGVAVIASPVVYQKTLEHGKTGLMCAEPAHFADRLIALVVNGGFRRQLTENAYKYVQEHRLLEPQVDRRIDWYRNLYRHRAQLTEALAERTPEIADRL